MTKKQTKRDERVETLDELKANTRQSVSFSLLFVSESVHQHSFHSFHRANMTVYEFRRVVYTKEAHTYSTHLEKKVEQGVKRAFSPALARGLEYDHY